MFGQNKPAPSAALAPPPASSRPDAREILRVWERRGHPMEVTLRPDAFADANGRVDPAAWGLLLVDIARHVAKAYEQALGADPKGVLERVRAGFDVEWDHPTDTPKQL